MAERTRYLLVPTNKLLRVLSAIPIALRLLLSRPSAVMGSLNAVRYGKKALSLHLLHQASHFCGTSFDVLHCHFGTVANAFLDLKEVVANRTPLITTLYGYDVSKVFKDRGSDFYDRLKRVCALFFVMSEDMKRRVLQFGFEPNKVVVHPVSIDVDSYPFRSRTILSGEPIQLAAVGRFTEKKGFDDLVKALAVVRGQSNREWNCTLIGGGELEPQLRHLVREVGLDNAIRFAGYLPVEQVVEELLTRHLLLAPSKTAANGDME